MDIIIPIDVQIYMNNMEHALQEEGFIEELIEDFGVQKSRRDELYQNLLDESLLHSLTNYQATGNPELNEEEFDMVITKACTSTVLSELQDEGMVEAIVDDGEVKYQLTKEWKKS